MGYRTAVCALGLASLVSAAEFHSGQAARAVIGQTSFSSLEQGIVATSLEISRNRLYASDASHHVFTFDLARIPDVRDELAERQASGCVLCGFSPAAVVNQSVAPGVAAVSVLGKTVVMADAANHRVLIWKDASSPRRNGKPDVVLGRNSDESTVTSATLTEPVSVAFDGKRIYVGDAALHRILIWNSVPTSDDQPADVVLGQPDFSSANASDSARPDSFQTPAALASDGANLFVGDPVNRRILVFSAADQLLAGNALVNSASLFDGPVAPGTLVTLSGTGLSETTESAESGNNALPHKLGGTEVLLDGQALPLLTVSGAQVQAQIPYELGNRSVGSLYVRTERSNGAVTVTTPIPLVFQTATPGLFAFSGDEPRPGVLLHADTVEADKSGSPVTAENPVKPGEIITIWAAGLGSTSAQSSGASAVAGVPYEGPAAPVLSPVTATINGETVPVLGAALPTGAIGIYEIRVAVPADLIGNEVQLAVSQNGFLSNTVTFPVQSPAR